jgi:hypothetical protein
MFSILEFLVWNHRTISYVKEFPKLMRLLDYDKFIITKATFMSEGGEKIVLQVTATIKDSEMMIHQ